jgi:hypothetical protein
MSSLNNIIENLKKEQEFKNKLSDLLNLIDNIHERKNRIPKYFKLLNVIDEYNEIVFYNNTTKYNKLIDTMEKKFTFFIKNEKDISEKTNIFLEKYYRCKAVCKYGNRCKNKINRKISNFFCGVHKNYIPTLKYILQENTNFNDKIIDKIIFYLF